MAAEPDKDLNKLSRYRSVFSEPQVGLLEEEYSRSNFVDFTTSSRLAQDFGYPEVVIRRWFQNRRARTKRRLRRQLRSQYQSQLLPCPDNIGHTLGPDNIDHTLEQDKIGHTFSADQGHGRLMNDRDRCQVISSQNPSTEFPRSHGSETPVPEISPGSKIRAVFNLQRSDFSGRGHSGQSSSTDFSKHPEHRDVSREINMGQPLFSADVGGCLLVLPEQQYDINKEYPHHDSIPHPTQFYPRASLPVILPGSIRSQDDFTHVKSKSNVETNVGINGRIQQVETIKHVEDEPAVCVKQEPSESGSGRDSVALSQEEPPKSDGGYAMMHTARQSSTARQTPAVSTGQVHPESITDHCPESSTDHYPSESSSDSEHITDPNTEIRNIPMNVELSEFQMNKLMSTYEETGGNVDILMSQRIAREMDLPLLQVHMWFQIRKQMAPRMGHHSQESCPESQSDGPRTVPGDSGPNPHVPVLVGASSVKKRRSKVPGQTMDPKSGSSHHQATDPKVGSSHRKTGVGHRKFEQISNSVSSTQSVTNSRMLHGKGGQAKKTLPPLKTAPAPDQNSGRHRDTMQHPQFYSESGCVFSVSPGPPQPMKDSSGVLKRKSCVEARDGTGSLHKLAKSAGSSKGKQPVKAPKQKSIYSPNETVGRNGIEERERGTDQSPSLVQYAGHSSEMWDARQTSAAFQGQGEAESIFEYFPRPSSSCQQSSDQNIERPTIPHTATSRTEFQISTLMNAYEEMCGEVDRETLSRLGHILDLPFLQVERWFQIRRQMDPRRRPERHMDANRPPRTRTVACPPRVSSTETSSLDSLTSLKNLAHRDRLGGQGTVDSLPTVMSDRHANRSGAVPERGLSSRGSGPGSAVSRTDSAVGGPRPQAAAPITGSDKAGMKRAALKAKHPVRDPEVGSSHRTNRAVNEQTELRSAVLENVAMQSMARIWDNFQLQSKSDLSKNSATRIPSNVEPIVHHGTSQISAGGQSFIRRSESYAQRILPVQSFEPSAGVPFGKLHVEGVSSYGEQSKWFQNATERGRNSKACGEHGDDSGPVPSVFHQEKHFLIPRSTDAFRPWYHDPKPGPVRDVPNRWFWPNMPPTSQDGPDYIQKFMRSQSTGNTKEVGNLEFGVRQQNLQMPRDMGRTSGPGGILDLSVGRNTGKVRDPQSHRQVQDPHQRVRDPHQHVKDPCECVQEPYRHLQDPYQRIQDPYPCILDPYSHVQDPYQHVQDQRQYLHAPYQDLHDSFEEEDTEQQEVEGPECERSGHPSKQKLSGKRPAVMRDTTVEANDQVFEAGISYDRIKARNDIFLQNQSKRADSEAFWKKKKSCGPSCRRNVKDEGLPAGIIPAVEYTELLSGRSSLPDLRMMQQSVVVLEKLPNSVDSSRASPGASVAATVCGSPARKKTGPHQMKGCQCTPTETSPVTSRSKESAEKACVGKKRKAEDARKAIQNVKRISPELSPKSKHIAFPVHSLFSTTSSSDDDDNCDITQMPTARNVKHMAQRKSEVEKLTLNSSRKLKKKSGNLNSDRTLKQCSRDSGQTTGQQTVKRPRGRPAGSKNKKKTGFTGSSNRIKTSLQLQRKPHGSRCKVASKTAIGKNNRGQQRMINRFLFSRSLRTKTIALRSQYVDRKTKNDANRTGETDQIHDKERTARQTRNREMLSEKNTANKMTSTKLRKHNSLNLQDPKRNIKITSPELRNTKKLTSPEQKETNKLTSPEQRKATKLTSKEQRKAKKLKSPELRKDKKLTLPELRKAKNLTSPEQRKAKNLTSPEQRKAKNLTSPEQKKANRLTSPEQKNANKLASPEQKKTKKLTPPEQRNASWLKLLEHRKTNKQTPPKKRKYNRWKLPGQVEEKKKVKQQNSEKSSTRCVLRPSQTAYLEEAFQCHKYLLPKMKDVLEKSTGLTLKEVSKWFMNRRRKEKKVSKHDIQSAPHTEETTVGKTPQDQLKQPADVVPNQSLDQDPCRGYGPDPILVVHQNDSVEHKPIILQMGMGQPEEKKMMYQFGPMVPTGTMLPEGTMMADGTMLPPGTMMPDGTMVPQGTKMYPQGEMMQPHTVASSSSPKAVPQETFVLQQAPNPAMMSPQTTVQPPGSSQYKLESQPGIHSEATGPSQCMVFMIASDQQPVYSHQSTTVAQAGVTAQDTYQRGATVVKVEKPDVGIQCPASGEGSAAVPGVPDLDAIKGWTSVPHYVETSGPVVSSVHEKSDELEMAVRLPCTVEEEQALKKKQVQLPEQAQPRDEAETSGKTAPREVIMEIEDEIHRLSASGIDLKEKLSRLYDLDKRLQEETYTVNMSKEKPTLKTEFTDDSYDINVGKEKSALKTEITDDSDDVIILSDSPMKAKDDDFQPTVSCKLEEEEYSVVINADYNTVENEESFTICVNLDSDDDDDVVEILDDSDAS